MKPYPEECPVFEVKRTGEIFDAAPWFDHSGEAPWPMVPFPIEHADARRQECYSIRELRPLTRAAREMLDLVK